MIEVSNNGSQAHWYVLRVYSSFEASAAKQIENTAEIAGCSELFEEINVPTIVVQSGKKPRTVVLCQGYVFLKMIYNEISADVIKKVPRVYEFLLADNKPRALSQDEYDKMLTGFAAVSEHSSEALHIGDSVQIKSGSFNGFRGTIISIDEKKSSITVSVSVFKRETHVMLQMSEVDRIKE